jgi:ABC-2 type transport system permease protein
MTKVASSQPVVDASGRVPGPRGVLRHSLSLGACGAVFWLTLRQQCRGRRLMLLSLLFALPAAIAILARYMQPQSPLVDLEFGLVLNLIPHALIPLTALLYGCGMIQDEIEEQTLTYLLIRPLPKWAIYVAKLAATVLVTAGLAALFTAAAFCAIYAGTRDLWTSVPMRALMTIGVLSLSLLAYCSLFGWLSLFVRRSLVVGIAYIVVFEGLLANIDFVARRLTLIYYFRVLILRWVSSSLNYQQEWAIAIDEAPSAWSCVEVLAGVTVVAMLLAVFIFTNREFRLKTPEGS